MKRTVAILMVVCLTAMAAACFHLFPPRINLEPMGTIGLIEFQSEAKGNIAEYATQVFLEFLLRSQPNARIKELGRAAEVLGNIGADRLGLEAYEALRNKYGVDTVFFGSLEVSKIRPRVDLAAIITSLSVSAEVDAIMMSRLVDTHNGTTIWTASARDRESVAHVSVFKGGDIFFDASNPEQAYGPLMRDLVRKTTRDFQWR